MMFNNNPLAESNSFMMQNFPERELFIFLLSFKMFKPSLLAGRKSFT